MADDGTAHSLDKRKYTALDESGLIQKIQRETLNSENVKFAFWGNE